MSGRVKQLIDELCNLRSGGNQSIEHFVRASLVLQGIDPKRFNERSPDDIAVERALQTMIRVFNGRQQKDF